MYKHARAHTGLQSIAHGSVRDAVFVARGDIVRLRSIPTNASISDHELKQRLVGVLVGRGYTSAVAERAAKIALRPETARVPELRHRNENQKSRRSNSSPALERETRAKKRDALLKRLNYQIPTKSQNPAKHLAPRPAINSAMRLKLEEALKKSKAQPPKSGPRIEVRASTPPQKPPVLPNSAPNRDAPDVAPSPTSPASSPVPEHWDPAQLEVIQQEPNARLLVDAGPGTGKTAVACRRVAELIDNFGVVPANIWIFSFTKTAVKEIVNRIKAYLQNPDDAYSVRIATIDSHAWAINSGFDTNASLSGKYEENIERVIELVDKHEGVFNYLDSVQHLVVDETQDVVGVRSRLLLAVLRKLPDDCGVTAFADEAQAIYTSNDESEAEGTSDDSSLARQLRGEARFQECVLTKIHRAGTKQLQKLFTDVRKRVLSDDGAGSQRVADVREMVIELADEKIDKFEPAQEFTDSTFVLFRRRVDVMQASAFRGVAPHRLRMSHLPVCLDPWLASVFWDHTERRITRTQFEQRWSERVPQTAARGMDMATAWAHVVRTAGESANTVSTSILRSRLARRNPPMEFCLSDFGTHGPVFGTIHGCKGREAETVLLLLPHMSAKPRDGDSEARVMFVGATRAKRQLAVGQGYKIYGSHSCSSGRSYVNKCYGGQVKAQVQIGIDADIDANSVVGQIEFPDVAAAGKAQEWLRKNQHKYGEAGALANPDLDFRYSVMATKSPILAVLCSKLNTDLFDIGRQCATEAKVKGRFRPPQGFSHVRFLGVRTVVIAPDAERNQLHEPWASSGFAFAPMITGFDMAYYRRY